MRLILATSTTLAFSTIAISTPAFAHIGHVAEVAGHSHWIALGALAAAGLITAWAVGKKKGDEDATDEEEGEEAEEEAPA